MARIYKTLFCCLLLLQAIGATAQCEGGNFRAFGGTTNDFGTTLTVDTSGQLVGAGLFTDTISFDSDTLVADSIADIYLVRTDDNIAASWAQHIPCTGECAPSQVITGADNNIYITGFFVDSITFGSTTLVSKGPESDVFLAKYDSLGTLIWVLSEGDSSADVAKALALDGSGHLYVAGSFRDSTQFDDTLDVARYFKNDAFLARYDTAGNFEWLRYGGSMKDDFASGLQVDNSGNAYP